MELEDLNPYKALNIKPNSTEAEIKTAYRTMAKKYHPDNNKKASAEKRFKLIAEAYKILSDSKQKRLYDVKTRKVVIIEASIKKETPKAYLLDVTGDFHQGFKGLEIWIPKSQVKMIGDNAAEVANWIAQKRAQEVREIHRGFIGFLEVEA
tara:strand:+ start:1733 stop:2185 length:453 start_codon:yes stop_codon:yes gene_type:complete